MTDFPTGDLDDKGDNNYRTDAEIQSDADAIYLKGLEIAKNFGKILEETTEALENSQMLFRTGIININQLSERSKYIMAQLPIILEKAAELSALMDEIAPLQDEYKAMQSSRLKSYVDFFESLDFDFEDGEEGTQDDPES